MKTILLLHGALGASQLLQPLRDAIAGAHAVHTLTFSGHGGIPLKNTFSIEGFAAEVLEYIAENKLEKVCIFGYSMGGYVALYLARHHPEVIEAVATLGTKLHWDAATAGREAMMLNPEKIKAKVPAFAAELKQRHHPLDWEGVVSQTAGMIEYLGENTTLPLHEIASIACPVLLALGDRDNMVTLVETVSAYNQLPHGQLAVLPATHHPFEKVNMGHLHCIVDHFFESV